MIVLLFKINYLSKVVTTSWFYILLHHAVQILDKRVFNQVNSIDAVNFLQFNGQQKMFALSIYF